ncbi:MAG: universal stress protein [Symploca sp. SIO1B1]|nr:universal stress protein [Symploca sp. SIO1B1]
MRYKKILAAIDCSPQAPAVFEQALEVAKRENASLMLFHCLPIEVKGTSLYADIYDPAMSFYNHLQTQLNEDKEEAEGLLEGYCQRAIAQGVTTEWQFQVGDAGSAIRDFTKSWDADLVVIGRRGRQGMAEVFLGSVSNYIVHNVSCSVLVVQGISPQKIEETS